MLNEFINKKHHGNCHQNAHCFVEYLVMQFSNEYSLE